MQIESLVYSDKLWQAVADFAQNCTWKAGPIYLVSDLINLNEKYGFIKIDEKEAPVTIRQGWKPGGDGAFLSFKLI